MDHVTALPSPSSSSSSSSTSATAPPLEIDASTRESVPLLPAQQRSESDEQKPPTLLDPKTKPTTTTCTMKRILVAGGAGFIGIHLCTKLLEQGHEVICLDNLYTSQRVNVLQLQHKYPNFEFVRHDITLPYMCEVDEIYNLACPASPVHYQYNGIKTTKVSFLGALNLLGLAKRVKGRIFQASTSEVYGDPEVSPQVLPLR